MSPTPAVPALDTPSRLRNIARDRWYDELAPFLYATGSALDIGPGIRPQQYTKPHVHVCVEAHPPYMARLQAEHGDNPRFVFLTGTWQDVLRHFPDNSIDSAFALDLIEHLEREEGFALLAELSRIVRYQVIVFTPLGFYPQHFDEGESDAWGMDGARWQEHRSGWKPEDMLALDDRWSAFVCADFHTLDAHQRPLAQPWPAFWAILTKAVPRQFPTVHELHQRSGRLGRLPAPLRSALRVVLRLVR